MFAAVSPPIKQADLALCHLETPLTTSNFQGYPVFATPNQLAEDIAQASFDSCPLASNHSLDVGPSGIQSTIDPLKAAQIKHKWHQH